MALVTGGSRGLGRDMVTGLAQAGADVIIASRDRDSCAQAAREVTEQTGRRALPYAVHVGRWAELDGLVAAAYAEFGHVDVLVNNAGMSPLYGTVTEVSDPKVSPPPRPVTWVPGARNRSIVTWSPLA